MLHRGRQIAYTPAMVRHLPPLNALRLFEAAGRHASFRRAAEELALTPSAISHGIRSLENWLGRPLFRRMSRGLVLTEAGAAYLAEVQDALQSLARATDRLAGRRSTGRLRLSVAPSFGLRWLLPRLPRFRARHPEIEITLDTEQRQVALTGDRADLAIRMGRGDWPGLWALHLVRESLAPVAAPAIAERLGAVADLGGQTLLHVATVSDDWRSWSHLSGRSIDGVERGPCFDSIHMALEAAAQGQGVVIGRWPLVAGDIAAGRLRAVSSPISCDTAYWLVGERRSFARREAAAFSGWIQDEFARAA